MRPAMINRTVASALDRSPSTVQGGGLSVVHLQVAAALEGVLHLTMNPIDPVAEQVNLAVTMNFLVPAAVQGVHHVTMDRH